MNKAVWTVAGVAFLGTAAGAVFVASSGGEEEVVQQQSSVSPTTSVPTAIASVTATPAPTPIPPSATPAPPSPAPLPDGWEIYVDPERGFSFAHPPGLTLTEQLFDQTDNSGQRVGQVRALSFRHQSGTPAISMAVAPNPNSLTLEEWIRTFPGWPSEPRPVTIGGESALLFETNQMGQRYPGVYFRHADVVLSISANVYGASELGVSASSGISESDFQRVMDGFRFGA
jgi:hypothetical protein